MADERNQAREMWAALSPKKKREYLWEYYKIHVYVGIFVLILVAVTVRDCATRVIPDITIAYVGSELQEGALNQLEATFSAMIQDSNADGKTVVSLVPVMDERKLFVMVAVQEAQLMFTRKAEFQQYASNGAFVPLDELLTELEIELDLDAYPEIVLAPQETQETHIYGIPLEQNALFTQVGANMRDTYLALMISGDSDKPEKMALYHNSLIIVHEILRHMPATS